MSWVLSDIRSDVTMFTSMKSLNYRDKQFVCSPYDKEADVQTLGAAGKWRFTFDQESSDEGGKVWLIKSAKYNNGFVYASDKITDGRRWVGLTTRVDEDARRWRMVPGPGGGIQMINVKHGGGLSASPWRANDKGDFHTCLTDTPMCFQFILKAPSHLMCRFESFEEKSVTASLFGQDERLIFPLYIPQGDA